MPVAPGPTSVNTGRVTDEVAAHEYEYNLTWSTDGVINEYCEPCEAIVDGKRREVLRLEEREEFSLDGVTYEAFNTSGGLGTLCETYLGRVRELNFVRSDTRATRRS